MDTTELSARFPLERTRRRILRVNAAGEAGAIAIYRAQLTAARWLPDEIAAFLRHAREHELEHYRKFRGAMQERGISPCPGTPIWIAGGWLLGWLSLLGGRRGVMACTAAIETTVHGHLEEQIVYLDRRDPELAELIRGILVEEIEHKEYGAAGYDPDCRQARAFTGLISAVTEALIWLATFGDSTRMRRAM